jgi:GTP-binding protein
VVREMSERTSAGSELPSVVIVGRPNVGKSTLFNRLTESRRTIVTNEPGITRDRIYGVGNWRGRAFEVVDTGGIVPDEQAGIPGEILRQTRVAIERAAQLVLVVDGRAGVSPLDADLARLLRRTGKPLVVAANKVDTTQQAALAAAFYELGSDVFPISAEHGYGVDDLLDVVTQGFAASQLPGETEGAREIRVAIIGRPNVGKSTLLNRMVGEERAIVSPEPGTTRDAVDTLLRRNGRAYRLVDTAGIRRKGKTKLVAEKLSVVMARKQLERADVALIVMDAAQGVTSNDATIAAYAQQSGCASVVVMNKWDLALKEAEKAATEAQRHRGTPSKGKLHDRGVRRSFSDKTQRSLGEALAHQARFDKGQLLRQYETLVRRKLKFLDYAPVIFLSALTGERTTQLFELVDRVAQAHRRRVPTRELNQWLAQVDLDRGTSPSGRRMKIYYVTQASVAPPSFVLFTNQARPMHFSYQRFLEDQLRRSFDFTGTPIRFVHRLKKR